MRLRDFALWYVGVAIIYATTALFPAPDIRIFLVPWLDHIKATGPISAFAGPFSNYSPPYLYLLSIASTAHLSDFATIKIISVMGVCWLAWCVAQLSGKLGRAQVGAINGTILLPTVILNGPVLGQCDSFWVGCCVLAVRHSIDNRPYRMAIWAGIALSFKAQAAFLAPFFIGCIIRERAWKAIAIPPIIYVAAVLPAALAGWPLANLLTIYIRQAQFTFIGDAPNLWAIPAALRVPGPSIFFVGYCVAALGAVLVIQLRRKDPLSVALLSALLLPFLLPKMLERFFFLADILSFAIAYIRRDRISKATFILVQTGSCLSIVAYLASLPWVNAAASLFMFSAIGITCWTLAISEKLRFQSCVAACPANSRELNSE